MPNAAPCPDLAPDCSRCDALCCVLLAYDASQAFALDKPACVACRHLGADNACGIHADLPGQGFAGCAVYTCYGAGQRITEQVFKGRSWRADPALMPALADAFRSLRKVHEAVWLVQQAACLPLTPAQDQRRQDLLRGLNAGQDWSEAGLNAPEQGEALKAVRRFLASLRDLPAVTPRRR